MALTEEQLDGASEESSELFERLEIALLTLVGASLLSANISSYKSAQAGGSLVRRQAAKLVYAAMPYIDGAVAHDITIALVASAVDDAGPAARAEMARWASGKSKAVCQATASKLKNTALGLVNGAQQAYVAAASDAASFVMSGMMGQEDAVYKAVGRMAEKGISTVDYLRKDGVRVHVNTDVAVRRTIRTTVTQEAMNNTLEIASKLDKDLVEVSSCKCARASHARWHGRVYSLSGKTKGYRRFATACKKGDLVDGIGGYNCDHTIRLWNKGMPRRSTTTPLKGTGYTQEEARVLISQQRRLEAKIRALKREKEVYRNLDIDTRGVNMSLASARRNLNSLISENERILQYQPWRVNAYDVRIRKAARR